MVWKIDKIEHEEKTETKQEKNELNSKLVQKQQQQ